MTTPQIPFSPFAIHLYLVSSLGGSLCGNLKFGNNMFAVNVKKQTCPRLRLSKRSCWNVAPDTALQVSGPLRLYQVCGVLGSMMEDADVMGYFPQSLILST
ncbi:hypothetical protein QL093DRAFT_2198517 [Fusarium oxysporum]|nr:hypothetical protein QL093DRAFT_2198517 [Fusarium oxysporum]